MATQTLSSDANAYKCFQKLLLPKAYASLIWSVCKVQIYPDFRLTWHTTSPNRNCTMKRLLRVWFEPVPQTK